MSQRYQVNVYFDDTLLFYSGGNELSMLKNQLMAHVDAGKPGTWGQIIDIATQAVVYDYHPATSTQET